MKNADILMLVEAGILNITDYDLSVESAYKIMKFRNKIEKLFVKLQEDERDLLSKINIDNINDFNKRYKELLESSNLSEDEQKELDECNSKSNEWSKLRSELYNSDVDLSDLKTISYEDWHKLRQENRPDKEHKLNPLNNYVERILENILWVSPEE